MLLKLKRRVAPGIWIDQNDAAHFSVPELLDHFGWPHDAEHIDNVKRAITDMWAKEGLGPVIVQPHCPNCGAGNGEAHGLGCALNEA